MDLRTGVITTTLFVSLSGCSFVKLTDAGKNVDIRVNSSTESCQRLGVITVNGVDKVGVVSRGDKKVKTELSTLARNDAAVMGANVIVPVAEPADGSQKFEAYNCP